MGNPFIQQKQPDINQLYQQFMQNPMQYLTGMNIPKELTTPQQMVEYCLNSGRYNIPPMIQKEINALRGMK